MSSTIFLIRHGVTAANRENRFAGRTREPLHNGGIEQIKTVGNSLQDKGIDRIITGPLARTRQSGEILSEVLNVSCTTDNAFNEISIAHWDGLAKENIREKFGSEYPTWLNTPDKFHVPGCETLADVQKRAVAGITRLFDASENQKIAVVSHLIVIRCIVLFFSHKPISLYRSIKIDNGKIVELCKDKMGGIKLLL